MSFEEYKELNELSSEDDKVSNIRAKAFASYLKQENEKDIAFKKPFEFLYEDITDAPLTFLYENALTRSDYDRAKDEAIGCLNISVWCRNVPFNNVNNWIQNSINCFQIVVLDFVQNVLKEKINKPKTRGGKEISEDRWAYCHLEEKEDKEMSRIGSLFNSVYQKLNETKHRMITNTKTGKFEIQKLNRRQLLESSISYLKDALTILQNKYNEKHPLGKKK